MKLYGDPVTGKSQLLIDGHWVVNGDWTAVFSSSGNVIGCRERSRSKKEKAPVVPWMMDVPDALIKKHGRYNYNLIMSDCEELYKKEHGL